MLIAKTVLLSLVCVIALGFIITLWWYLQYSDESWRSVYTENSITTFLAPCTLPQNGFSSWKRGLVTSLKSTIQRNCSLLFQGDPDEIQKVKIADEHWNSTTDTYEFFDWTLSGNCTRIRGEFLNNFYVSREELDFPLAFSMSIHDSPEQIVRLLKVIYRPHNLYCIHYDLKSSNRLKQVFENIAKCLSNVFITSKIIKVYWGDYTILDAQLNCIRDIYNARFRVEWKYLVTLCGKELPLRTNREIVTLLKPLNGTSALIHFDLPDEDRWRVEQRSFINKQGNLIRSQRRLGRVPHNLKIYKNLAYFGLTPEFVRYILYSPVAKDLLQFMHKGVSSPEEHFYSTLFALPDIPGGYRKEMAHLIPNVISAIWLPNDNWEQLCSGWFVHWICIISSGDLHRIDRFLRTNSDPNNQVAMFHNKYFMERDHTVMDCVEEELVSRNREEYVRDCTI